MVSPSVAADVKIESFEGRHRRLRETTFQLLTIFGTVSTKCGCARNEFKATATVYEVWPVKIEPGLDSYNSGKLQVTDQNPIRARKGYSGGKLYFIEVRFITAKKIEKALKDGTLKRFVWYGPEGDHKCSSSPRDLLSTGSNSWEDTANPPSASFSEEEVPEGHVPQWWSDSKPGAKRVMGVGYSCCGNSDDYFAGMHDSTTGGEE